MMISYINDSLSGGLSPKKTEVSKSSSFNRMLTETAASLSGKSQPIPGRTETQCSGSQQESPETQLVKIGTISSKNPTVSDLLIQNSALKDECWDIIYNQRNNGKEYTRIRVGTDIYLNPDTKELLWGDAIQKTAGSPMAAGVSPGTHNPAAAVPDHEQGWLAADDATMMPEAKADGLSEKLVKAVLPMIGKGYSDVDCFELLVNGLNKIGIRYGGRNGLGRKLIDMALGKGLPMNAYLTGEGLIQASGSKVYGKSFNRVDDPKGQAGKLIEEIAPYLEKGAILSFSMESRGHTGIVSSKDGSWTYINSGVMDNPVTGTKPRKGVGEENLIREIENWFEQAARRNESLVVTLGKLNRHKLAAFGKKKDLTVS